MEFKIKIKFPLLVKAGRAIRLLGWVGLAFTGVYSLALFSLKLLKGHPENMLMLPPLVFTALIFTIVSVFYIVTGEALMKSKFWSRFAGILIGAAMLMFFPIGTLLGLYILWCVIKGWNETPSQ